MAAAGVARSQVEAFYRAFASRDPDRIAPFLAGDVEWMIVGPVDLLHFCGHRHGKAAVLDLFRRIVPEVIEVAAYVPEVLLVDGDRAASYGRIVGHRHATGRTISYRCAHFLRFADDKVAECHSVIDSFDAAEQVLGHPFDLGTRAKAGSGELKVISLVKA